MCGIVGIVNYSKNISHQKELLSSMVKELEKRGPDEDGIYIRYGQEEKNDVP